MNLIIAIIIGGLVGWLASILMKTNSQMGILANVIIGIIGSFLGSSIADMLGLPAHEGLGGWIVAVMGAGLLIAVLKALASSSGSRRCVSRRVRFD